MTVSDNPVGKKVRRACSNFVGRNAHSQRMRIANLQRSSQRRTSCAFTTNAHVNIAAHAQYAFAANAKCDLLVKFSKPNKMRIHCECSMRLSSEVRKTFPIRIRSECAMRPCSEDPEADLDAHSLRMRCATSQRSSPNDPHTHSLRMRNATLWRSSQRRTSYAFTTNAQWDLLPHYYQTKNAIINFC